jgi:prepilin-type N-terminal cleavage/methylation domain-containing protein
VVKIRSERGLTLVEILVSLGIFSVVVGGFSLALIQMFSGLSKSGRSVDQQLGGTLLQSIVNRKLAMSTLKSYALSGSSIAGETHARSLLVLPGLCADLSSGADCKESTVLAFTSVFHFDQTAAAYCWVVPGQRLIVESTIEPLMAAVGPTSNLIGLVAAPIMTNWGVKSVRAFGFTNDLTGAPYSADCVSRLPREANGRLRADRFRELEVDGFNLQRTPTTLTPALQAQYNTIFPQRIARLNLYSSGLMPAGSTRSMGGTTITTDFKILACRYDPQVMINCEGAPAMASVPRVRASGVVESFSLPFTGSGASSGAQTWQILGTGQTKSTLCELPTCGILPAASVSSLPYRSSETESIDQLSANGFSLLKQNFVNGLRFVLETDGSKTIPIHFNVE